MAEYNIGASGEGVDDLARRMQQASQSIDEMNRKEEQRRATEERVAGTEEGSARVRTSLTQATRELSSALGANTSVLGLETQAISANTAALERNLQVRRSLSSTVGFSEAGGAAAGATRTRTAVIGGVSSADYDPQAAARLQAAQRALAEAEIARAEANRTVATSRRASGTTPEVLAPLVEQQQLARDQVAAARGELRASQQNAERSQQAATLRDQELAEQQQINQALAQRRQADEQAAQQAARQAAVEAEATARMQASLLGIGRTPQQILATRNPLAPSGPLLAGGSSLSPGTARYLSAGILGTAQRPYLGTLAGGPAERIAVPEGDAGEQLTAYRQRATENATALQTLEGRQRAVNQSFAEAGAIYADTSTRLSRHGALTTEFIQALAHGQVTMREFGEQMVSTIGKFGGWAVAGAAVYGVVGAFRDLLHGATETQGAVQNLGRFIPGLGGPAGGGRSQVGHAEESLRGISAQFNLPISDVANAMQVVARVYHNVTDAAAATRGVLAFTRLDQVPEAEAVNYTIGISQALNFRRGQDVITQLVNPLNALQSLYGARVSQTLPAVARAAPAALAGGIDLPTLNTIAALGVRSGQTGASIGTAITRGLTRFAFTPASELTFREYGINPQVGQGGDLINQVAEAISSRARRGQSTDKEVLALSQALGGPQLGVRSFAPILEQIALRPGLYQSVLSTARDPRRSYTEDLNATLSTVSERFKSIGITLQNFGSQLAQAGLLSAITGVLDGFNLIAHATEQLASPLIAVAGAFNQLPHAVQDAIGVFLAFRAVQYLSRTTFGGTATQFIGRLPGVDATDQAAVLGTANRLDRELIPYFRNRQSGAASQYLSATAEQRATALAVQNFQNEPTNIAASQAATGSQERERYERSLSSLLSQEESANRSAARAEQEYAESAALVADLEGQLVALKDTSLSFARRASILEQESLTATGDYRDAVRERADFYRSVARGEGGGAVAGGAAVGAAAAGAAAIVGAEALARSPSTVGELLTTAQRTQAGAPTSAYRLATTGAATESEASLGALSQLGLLGATGATALAQRASGALATARGILTGPGAPAAGLIASQLIGGAVGGGAGSYIQDVGGGAAGGALIAQLLGKGSATGLLTGLAVGSLASNLQRGTGLGAGIGAGVGGVIGGALGSFTDLFTGPAGTIGGIAIGSTIGGAVQSLFGGGGSQQTYSQDVGSRANQRIARLLAHGTQAQQNAFITGQFQQDLADSLYSTGNTQARGAAGVNSLVNGLVAQQELYGSGGPQGRGIATQQISLLLSSTLQNAAESPAAALQVIQTLTQARSKAATDQYSYGLAQATTPGGARAADVAAQAQFGTLRAGVAGGVASVQQSLEGAQAELAAARAHGIQKDIDAAQAQVARYQRDLTGARNAAAIANAALSLQQQAIAQQAYAEEQQFNQSTGALAAARAGGDRRGQLLAQQRQLRSDLRDAYTTPGLSAQQRRTDINNANAGLSQNYTAQVQQQFAEVQAQGQLLQSTAPAGDPVAAARLAVQAANEQLRFMQAHARAFDPTQIIGMQAQLNSAQTALAQSIGSQAETLITTAAQTAAAGEFGDALAQAQTLLGGAERAVGVAVGPVAQAQARLQVAQAQAQVVAAQQQRIQEQGQLAASQHPGDPVAQAQAQIALAQRELAAAHGYDQVIAAQTALNNANAAYNQAVVQRYQSLGALQASETPEPLQQLARQIHATGQALKVAVGPQPRQQLQTQLNQQKQQYQATFTSQQEATIQFMFDMMQIPASAAVAMLEKLRKSEIGKVPKATIQGLDELIRRFQLGLEQPLGGGTFDLAPGNIRLPTFYDVSRAIQSGRPAGLSHRVTTHTATQINVYVGSRADVPAVADAIDRATSGHLRARLRAAGVR